MVGTGVREKEGVEIVVNLLEDEKGSHCQRHQISCLEVWTIFHEGKKPLKGFDQDGDLANLVLKRLFLLQCEYWTVRHCGRGIGFPLKSRKSFIRLKNLFLWKYTNVIFLSCFSEWNSNGTHLIVFLCGENLGPSKSLPST